jgi:hypothetical protein
MSPGTCQRDRQSVSSLNSRDTCDATMSKLWRHCASAMMRSKCISVGHDDDSLLTMYWTPLLSTEQRRIELAKRWPYSVQTWEMASNSFHCMCCSSTTAVEGSQRCQ